MKTLIEKRNIKFHEAVDELLVACAVHEPPQDPVELLLAATDDYLPVNDADESQTGRHSRQGDLEFYLRNPELRPSIEDLLAEMIEDEDYRGQVVENGHKVYEERDPVFGAPPSIPTHCDAADSPHWQASSTSRCRLPSGTRCTRLARSPRSLSIKPKRSTRCPRARTSSSRHPPLQARVSSTSYPSFAL